MRGQSNLVALAAGLLALTAATTLGLALADTAIDGADRPVEDRRLATDLAARLVAPDSPLAERANVVNASDLRALDAATLASRFPVVADRSFRLRLDGRTVAGRGDPIDGATVRRLVLIAHRESVTRTPNLTAGGGTATLPRRTERVRLRIAPPDGTVVTTVRADGRVLLHNGSGLSGTYTVAVSRFETVDLRVEAVGAMPTGSVRLTYFPDRTTKAVLEVTVGASR